MSAIQWPPTYAAIEPMEQEWAWLGKIPIGTVTGIFGPEGIAKGLMLADLTARWTRGDVMPDGSRGLVAGSVLMVTTEDDSHITMAHRLPAAKAVLGSVVNMTDLSDGSQLYIPANLTELREAITARGDTRALILDPLADISGVNLTSTVNTVRQKVTNPLMRLANEKGIAIIAVMHTTKDGKTLAGSAGLRAAFRSVLRVELDKSDSRMRILMVDKSNGAETGPSTAIRYTLAGEGSDTHVVWQSAISDSTDDVEWITHPRPGFNEGWSRDAGQSRIITVLGETLPSMPYGMLASDIASGIGAGYTATRTLLKKMWRHGDLAETDGLWTLTEQGTEQWKEGQS